MFQLEGGSAGAISVFMGTPLLCTSPRGSADGQGGSTPGALPILLEHVLAIHFPATGKYLAPTAILKSDLQLS